MIYLLPLSHWFTQLLKRLGMQILTHPTTNLLNQPQQPRKQAEHLKLSSINLSDIDTWIPSRGPHDFQTMIHLLARHYFLSCQDIQAPVLQQKLIIAALFYITLNQWQGHIQPLSVPLLLFKRKFTPLCLTFIRKSIPENYSHPVWHSSLNV